MMMLSNLLAGTSASPVTSLTGMNGVHVSGITADSRQVAPGWVFAALPGQKTDGRRFIADAVERGAAAILAPTGTAWPPGVPPRPMIQDAEPRRLLALMAARLAGAQPHTIAAITGTNGKTSTADFLRQIWTMLGRPAASLGTLGLIAEGFPPQDSLTTPDPVTLAQTLAMLARTGIQHTALEASSHGLDQFRLDGVRLSAAAFTNLTRDHLDYHRTEAAYRTAKLRLFADLLPAGAPAIASPTLDQVTLDALRGIARRRGLRLIIAGSPDSPLPLLAVEPHAGGQYLTLREEGVTHRINVPLPGRFQADNIITAATIAASLGKRGIVPLLSRLTGVRGRMEQAATLPNGAAIYVDYAHTPDALERLLDALRPHTTGKLHVVFGAGGDRDPGKRPLMGEAARTHADRLIVTDDNPRSENPAKIRAAILAACPDAEEIGDRAEAIAHAIRSLQPGDVLVIAGKGHEQGQTVGKTVHPFDDVSVARTFAAQVAS
ncbi:UDP-N-acetylmuramoylalanyl-D-glutamate--2,6-diaminopimelate ligase [Granulibacter bethesdensis]|uniref:UDP-N-acetylmuramoyl-L-alanyl-D-glutamate--2,6-diaminopimelate ligase n=2 Tax=Granulibacter bethesdensis TaxID=364410 RepID=A0AAC9K692_9PROT|nr:UDP-N-acetylmuramoylalanyl-D-glutamate--2,6-diaminopimelate ligase [Granulibacter bethesdensis]APH61249.1 UDP-N-acetylmuramoylalanyl-D-glutamate--2,6-diaminopimelate ligase [Granulibacter bethesdensis]